jgi:hypothetical protein
MRKMNTDPALGRNGCAAKAKKKKKRNKRKHFFFPPLNTIENTRAMKFYPTLLEAKHFVGKWQKKTKTILLPEFTQKNDAAAGHACSKPCTNPHHKGHSATWARGQETRHHKHCTRSQQGTVRKTGGYERGLGECPWQP